MAYDTENHTPEDVGKVLVEAKEKLTALESTNSQKKDGGSQDK